MATPTAPSTGGGSPLGFLRTRQGKIVAGAAGVGLVVILALSRRSGGGVGTGIPLAAQTDQTLADRLDQFGMSGGTLEDLIGSQTDLAGEVARLRDILETQDQVEPPPAGGNTKPLASGARRLPSGKVVVPWAISKPTSLRDIAKSISKSKDPTAVESTLRGLVKLNPQLKAYGRKPVPRGLRILVPDRRYYG